MRVIRAITGLERAEFAEKMDVTVQCVRWWEQGKSTPNTTNRKTLSEFCEAFGIAIRPDGYPVVVD